MDIHSEKGVWEPRCQEGAPIGSPIVPAPLLNALFSRGYKDEASIQNLISPSLSNLTSPFSIWDMEKAAERLVQAYENEETLAIYADFDLDGSSGLALFYKGLQGLGYKKLLLYQPKRLTEGYGLHSHAVEELSKLGAQVLVSIDVGITAVEAAQKALDLGIDLIITDHHQAGEILPQAYALVNPNLPQCSSGLGYLCGAGVAFYLLLAVRSLLAKKQVSTDFNPKDVLDFFGIGTLTDLVPLVKDNRVLIKHGLEKLSKTQRPALRLLIDRLGFQNRNLTSQDVAIQIAPKLNALSRMENKYLPRHVFLEEDLEKSQEVIEQVLEMQEKRKSLQKESCELGLEMAQDLKQEGYCWISSKTFHKGVIGLVATDLCGKLRVPCFVGAETEEGIIAGSARAPEDIDASLVEILSFCQDPLDQYGGHPKAAGFSLPSSQASDFDKKLQEFFKKNPLKKTLPKIIYDTEILLSDLTPSFMKALFSLEPYGKDFPPFQFLLKSVVIRNKRVLKEKHIKWVLQDDSQKTMEALMFFANPHAMSLEKGQNVQAIVEPRWNYFNGSRTIQLNVSSIRPD